MSAAPRPTGRSSRGLRLLLILVLAVVVLQQQLLWRRPPRLLELSQAAASSGPAALSLRFSRPMEAGSVATATRLQPALPFTVQGEGNPLLLLPAAGLRIDTPLTVRLGGRDRRGLPLATSQWHWDPRPHLVAVVPTRGGEQVQVRQHDGRWTALTPVWPSIPVLEPLGDGSGLGLVSRDETGGHSVWRLDLSGTSLSRSGRGLAVVGRRRLERLSDEPLLFAHLSSNRVGELLVQAARLPPLGDTLVLHGRDGGQRPLPLDAQGPVALLPQGGAAIVPEPEGLALRSLPPRPERRQVLPGSRDLSGFCPVAGRALLVRHWPDFRRSLELVEPGQAPRPLWIGTEGLVASACSRSGERVWALLIDGLARPRLSLVAFDRQGRVLQRRVLEGWELEPGTGLHYDPTGDRLLLALRPLPGPDATEDQLRQNRQQEARPALIDATSLKLELLDRPVRQVHWLKAA